MDQNCIFCKIINGDIPSKIIHQNNDVITILSLQNYPLVVTKRHIENIYEMDDETATEVMKETVKITKAVKKGLNADGINLVQNNEEAAGQEVMHFHMHIKPRFKADNVKIDFASDIPDIDSKKTNLEKIKSALD